jgi:CheY-like chemotaxis protein
MPKPCVYFVDDNPEALRVMKKRLTELDVAWYNWTRCEVPNRGVQACNRVGSSAGMP